MIPSAAVVYVRLRLERYAEDDRLLWAQRLARTAWETISVYFMREPTAPAYAKTLMAFAEP